MEYGALGRAPRAGFRLEALLSHSAGGVNAAMMAWGERMMAGSGKTRRGRRAIDFTLSHLGFSTDAGTYSAKHFSWSSCHLSAGRHVLTYLAEQVATTTTTL